MDVFPVQTEFEKLSAFPAMLMSPKHDLETVKKNQGPLTSP